MNICIPFGALFLVLTEDEFNEARSRGEQIIGLKTFEAEPHSVGRLLDAKGISEVTGIPSTWFLEQARKKKIPHHRGGKYVRFKECEILEALSVKNDRRLL